METEVLTLIIGLVAGFSVGLVGIGGGTLVMPFLVLYLKLPVLVAIGTDLVFAAFIKWIGATKHARQRTVDWRTTRSLLEEASQQAFWPRRCSTSWGMKNSAYTRPFSRLWLVWG